MIGIIKKEDEGAFRPEALAGTFHYESKECMLRNRSHLLRIDLRICVHCKGPWC